MMPVTPSGGRSPHRPMTTRRFWRKRSPRHSVRTGHRELHLAALLHAAIVEPANQFDRARLDPDNPARALTLQPSNARLLNGLAEDFVKSKFDLKALMRSIVNSQAYQLSSRYDPAKWDVAWEPLYARKLVRRLWAEEVHDAVAQSSTIGATYKIANFGTANWAMQFPEPRGIPGGRS